MNLIEEICKDKSIRTYQKGKFLGKGGFAKVYEITNMESKKVYASKIIPKASLTKHRAKSKLMTEIKIHKSLDDQNVVKFEHFFEDNENVYILLELCTNQTMNELIKRRKRLTEMEVQCYALQILSGLKYLHEIRVIHRDMKLGNLFLNEKMEIKLGDFGLATRVDFDGERKKTVCGTPNYIAPEILEGKNGHSYEVDIWSFGVILYTLLIGKPPFETTDVKSTYRRIKMNAYSFPDSITISTAARNLIQKVLQLDPASRLTLNEIQSHEFFKAFIPKLLPYIPKIIPNCKQISLLNDYIKQRENSLTNSPLKKNKFENTTPAQNKPDFLNKPLNTIGSQYQSQAELQKFKNPVYKSVERMENNFVNGLAQPEAWVTKWVDYSSKYGLGYLLQSGECGVFFNDCSKILLSSTTEDLLYYERNGQQWNYTLSNYDQQLVKKITLLHHFRNYLLETKTPPALLPGNSDKLKNKVYVKKWFKSKHAIAFRFSNKTVQTSFSDGTQVILSQQLKVVNYYSKKNQWQTMLLSIALESENSEMVKRLKYTKEILSQMFTNEKKQKENLSQRSGSSQQHPLQEKINQESRKQCLYNNLGNNNNGIGICSSVHQLKLLNTYASSQKLMDKNYQTLRSSQNFQKYNM